MRLDWLAWSNPVAIWWSFLIVVSAGNIALLLRLQLLANPGYGLLLGLEKRAALGGKIVRYPVQRVLILHT